MNVLKERVLGVSNVECFRLICWINLWSCIHVEFCEQSVEENADSFTNNENYLSLRNAEFSFLH